RGLQPDAAVVRDAQQRDDAVQLAAGLLREVDPGDAEAELEAQGRVVAQGPGHPDQVLARDVDGQLAAVDHVAADRFEREALLLQAAFGPVGDAVEITAAGPLARAGQLDAADEAAVAGCVAAVTDAEHALADGDQLAAVGAAVLRTLFIRTLLIRTALRD